MSDHEYFCIHKDQFYRVQSNHQEKNISLKVIQTGPNAKDSQTSLEQISQLKKSACIRGLMVIIQLVIIIMEKDREMMLTIPTNQLVTSGW